MANIIDYIAWRGDLSFEAAPFNEVDNLILSELSYFNFSNIVPEKLHKGIPLYQVAEVYFREERDKMKNTGDLILKDFATLLKDMAACNRYKYLKLKMYTAKTDEKEEMQFAALTIDLGNHELYIAFRGTDDTLLGWKEDFKMSVLDTVPAQHMALDYFNKVAHRHIAYKLYIGGHSKGGNLAVYSAVHTTERLKKRITQIFNNDGPGFKETLIGSKLYQAVASKIVTLVPQSSVIGMLLEHEENYTVVQSNQKGLLQHDGFSWEVLGNQFVHLKQINPETQLLDKTMKSLLNELSDEQKEQFTNVLFEILSSNEAKTITDLKEDSWKSVISMVKTFSQLDQDLKKALTDTLGLLVSEGIKSMVGSKLIRKNMERNIYDQ